MENGKKPAFSVALMDNGNATHPVAMGLTKREYFAAIAMQGLLACPNLSEEKGEVTNQIIANESVYLADRLLKALETIKPE